MDKIVIAGGHGKIALRLERLLAARGDIPVGLIRNPAHADDLLDVGARPVVCDLENARFGEVRSHLSDATAVVFAAGAGPGSGVERKTTVDRNAAISLADAAEYVGIRRFIVVSAMNVDQPIPEDTDTVFAEYLRAKGQADDDIRQRDGLDWTILRPGRLTDEPGTGQIWLDHHTDRGSVPRDDVAAVLAALLAERDTARQTFDLVSGDEPVADALTRLARPAG